MSNVTSTAQLWTMAAAAETRVALEASSERSKRALN
jgi:hypothetical protein